MNYKKKFSHTEIQILENGLRWIREGEDRFAIKLYNRLIRDQPGLNPLLQLIGPSSFNKDVVHILEGIIRELRSHGNMKSPFKEFWPEIPGNALPSLEPSELNRVTDIFLDLVSELAEDAWSPAVEYVWRKVIKSLMTDTSAPINNSFFILNSKPFLFNKEIAKATTPAMMFYFGITMLMAGGIAALGFWRRCHLVKAKEPLRFSHCV